MALPSSLFSLTFEYVQVYSAVASQLVPRGTWRHLVSCRTGAGTAEGCGRLSSVPAEGAVAVEARLQGVTGAGTHSLRGAAMLFSVTEVLLSTSVVTVTAVVLVWLGPV